jgi:CBS-domain-containing membrane protein
MQEAIAPMRNSPIRSRLRFVDAFTDRSKPQGDAKQFPRWDNRFKSQLAKLGGSSRYQPHFSFQQALLSWLGSFLGIAVLAYLTMHTTYPLIAAPFGATAVLVYAVPESPLAQPRNVICGNFLGALVCVICVALFGSQPWVMAFAVATAIKLMQLTRTLHPPGGAVALVGVMSHADWHFVLTPVLLGSLVMVTCTIAFNNLVCRKPYPKHWF